MAATPATILCIKHNVAKIPMRNGKGAPMLGCPVCHGITPEPAPAPEFKPQPTPEPAPAARRGRTFFSRLLGD